MPEALCAPPVLPLTEDMLSSPRAWGLWRQNQGLHGRSVEDSLAELRAFTGDYAAIRTLLLYSFKGEPFDETAHHYAKICLTSDVPSIRAFALVLLAHDDRYRYQAASHQSGPEISTAPAVNLIVEQLHVIRASGSQNDFSLEVQAQLLYDLSVLHRELGHDTDSMNAASEGIFLSLPLGHVNLTSSLKMSFAYSAMGSGRSEEALQKYLEVSQTTGANLRQRLYSTLNVANLYLFFGDYPSALEVIRQASAEYPNRTEVEITRQFVEAFCVTLPLDAEILSLKPQNNGALNRALQLVGHNELNPKLKLYDEALAILKDVPESAAIYKSVARWLQAHCLFRTGKPFLAAQRIQGFDGASLVPVLRTLALALRVEMALHPDGYERDGLGEITRTLAQSFATLKNQAAAARLLTLWYPTASAFLAMSPYSSSELVDEAMPAIFAAGRPVRVYGQGVPVKVTFVQITLEAFGIAAGLPRDTWSEEKRMRPAVVTTWGGAEWTRPVIPPALLIVNYLRLAEREGGLWRNAARQLEQTHGLIPETKGEFLRQERRDFHDALMQLSTGDIDAKTFDRLVAKIQNEARQEYRD